MGHFFGSVKGHRGEATRLGAKKSGLVVVAASYEGSVHVALHHNSKLEHDVAHVTLEPWHGNGKSILLYSDPVSGERSSFSETERLCLDFLTSEMQPVEKGDKVICTVDKALYHQLRQFMLHRSVGSEMGSNIKLSK